MFAQLRFNSEQVYQQELDHIQIQQGLPQIGLLWTTYFYKKG
jgi:hypothetical protein